MRRHKTTKRSAASLADTPTGRPRKRNWPWGRVTLAACGIAFVSRAVYGLLPPALTPEQVYDINSDMGYARWKPSRESTNFEKLRRAASALSADSSPIGNCYTTLRSKTGRPHTAAEIDDAVQKTRELVARHQSALILLREPVVYAFSLPPPRNLNEDTSYLRNFLDLARLNSLAAELKRRDGDIDGAANALADGMEFGRILMTSRNFNRRANGIVCQSMAARPLWEVLPQVSPAAYPRLMGYLQDATAVSSFDDAVQEEKRLGQRTILQLFDGKPLGQQLRSPSVLTVGTFVWSKRATFTNYTAYQDAVADLSTRPYRRNEPKPPLPSELLNHIFLFDLSSTRFKDVEMRAHNALLLQAAGVYAFRAKTGHLPATLEETRKVFVPTNLCFGSYESLKLPTDPFGQDKLLLYRRTGSTFLLYSVGPDGRDDGGKAIVHTGTPAKAQHLVTADSTGDMVGGINF